MFQGAAPRWFSWRSFFARDSLLGRSVKGGLKNPRRKRGQRVAAKVLGLKKTLGEGFLGAAFAWGFLQSIERKAQKWSKHRQTAPSSRLNQD